jgi:dsDNA-binding SOS-regulon protein
MGESKMGLKGVPPGLFATGDWKLTKGGKRGKGDSLDNIANRLRAEGWDIPDDPVDGGVWRLSEMINDELGGKKSYSFADTERVAAYERDLRMFQEAEDLKPLATELESIGLDTADTVDGTLVSRAAEIDEGAVERLSIQFAEDDAGFMQGIKEIIDGADKGAKAGEAVEKGAGAQALELTGETEAQIRAREAAERVAREKAAQQSKAPPPQDFTLSGSARPVDEAAARGQTGFSDFLNSTRP